MKIVNTISELGNIPPHTPCLFFHGDSILVLKQQDKYALPEYQKIHFKLNTQAVFFMTSNEGMQLLVADLNDINISDEFILENIKTIYHYFNTAERHWIAKTFGYIHWYRKHRFCGICARPTELDANECAMLCPNCHYHFYPKVNTSMIVLVYRGDEILLARSPHFPPEMYSVLAGYVSPGESVEETIVREVKEEVNIDVKNIRYYGSQAWPFPNTLMLGYYAEYASGDMQIDNKEIEAAGWYTQNNLPQIPRNISIARQLIDHFFNNRDTI